MDGTQLDPKDRVALLLTAIQVFGPGMTDPQVAAVTKAIFLSLGVDLPEAQDPTTVLEV